MPVSKNGQGVIVYTKKTEQHSSGLLEGTGVEPASSFAVADDADPLKQVAIDPSSQATNTRVILKTQATTPGSNVTITLPASDTTIGAVLDTTLTGFSSGAGTVTSADTVLSAFNKLDGNIALKVASSTVGQANGVASLDSNGRLPASQLPTSAVEYKGTWNASTNTPTLADGTGDAGDQYIVSVGATRNLGSGNIVFNVGDLCMYNGSIWQNAGGDSVLSVNGQTGVVSLSTSDVAEGTNQYFTQARVIASPLTGYSASAGTISSSDTILTAMNKIGGTLANKLDGPLTGDVTTSGSAATIAANVVSNAKLAQMATATFKGRTSSGTGNAEDLTATQATALLNTVVGDSGSGGTKGLVPAPAAGDAAAGYYLGAAGTFSKPPGDLTALFGTKSANTVYAGPTSGAAAAPTFRALVGADLPNPSASSLGGVQSKAVVSQQYLTGISTSGVPSSAQPSFSDLSGTAALTQGGTGASYASVTALFNAISPLTTKGDILVHNGTDDVRLAVGTNNHVLTADSTAANGVKWAAVSGGSTVGNDYGMVYSGTGFGSTNQKVMNFASTASNGSSVTPATSATNGASLTINTSGIYTIDFSSEVTTSLNRMVLTVNDATMAIGTPYPAGSNYLMSSTANSFATFSYTGYFASSSVIRAGWNNTGLTLQNGTNHFCKVTRLE